MANQIRSSRNPQRKWTSRGAGKGWCEVMWGASGIAAVSAVSAAEALNRFNGEPEIKESTHLQKEPCPFVLAAFQRIPCFTSYFDSHSQNNWPESARLSPLMWRALSWQFRASTIRLVGLSGSKQLREAMWLHTYVLPFKGFIVLVTFQKHFQIIFPTPNFLIVVCVCNKKN